MNFDNFVWNIEADIYFLTNEEGGRRTPVLSGHRGQFFYDGYDWDGIQSYPDVDKVELGTNVRTYISFLSPEHHCGKLFPGKEFLVREGSKTVGRGKVTRIINLVHAKLKD